MVKLCVTTDNGLYPLGYAQALSTKCRDLSEKWSRIAGALSAPASQPSFSAAAVYAKSDLKFSSFPPALLPLCWTTVPVAQCISLGRSHLRRPTN